LNTKRFTKFASDLTSVDFRAKIKGAHPPKLGRWAWDVYLGKSF
jgi:hypothetical protein